MAWTGVQRQRLQELGASEQEQARLFSSAQERDRAFQQVDRELVRGAGAQLLDYRETVKEPALVRLEGRLSAALVEAGFSRVTTPLFLAKGLLSKMSITAEHPLYRQVFWVDDRKCLRPMLAPNLYYVLKDLLRLWSHPVSIFEIGPCFRKDTAGGSHSQEFTMLNLVEMGLPLVERAERIRVLAELVMAATEVDDYRYESESSAVYGETFDIVSCGLELGSGAMGPHELDDNWEIDVPWVGIGFGLERLVMVREGYNNIQKAGRSLTYLNGVRLNI